MYITAFAPISSITLEIGALLFAINRFRENLKNTRSTMDKVGCGKLKAREKSCFKWKAIFLQGESMNASEGKKFP